MSLILAYSIPKVICKTGTPSVKNGRILVDNNLNISHENIDIDINQEDFCALISYFLTNTDLVENDPRLELVKAIKKYKIKEGYNKNNKRIVI
jgi:hypothetical protein